MTIDLNHLLFILYTLLIVLVIIFIIIGIKLIKALKKLDQLVDDVNEKMGKVDGVFSIIDKTTDFASNLSDKIVSAVSNFLSLIVKRKKGKDENEEEQ